jgi:NAD-dependent histone deacetylase SIR2
MNKDPPPPGKEYEWDLVVSGPCNKVAQHADLPRWDEPRPIPAADGDVQSPCVFIPTTPKDEAPKLAPTLPAEILVSPLSIGAIATRPTPPPKTAKTAKTAVALKLPFGKVTKANAKPQSTKAATKPTRAGVRKPRGKTSKKDGAQGSGRITFNASKAVAVMATVDKKPAKDNGPAKDIKVEASSSASSGLLSSHDAKEPMHQMSPAERNAILSIDTTVDDDHREDVDKDTSISPTSGRGGYAVSDLLN